MSDENKTRTGNPPWDEIKHVASDKPVRRPQAWTDLETEHQKVVLLLAAARPYMRHKLACRMVQKDAEDETICTCGLRFLLDSIEEVL